MATKPALRGLAGAAAVAMAGGCVTAPDPAAHTVSCSEGLGGEFGQIAFEMAASDGRTVPMTVFHPQAPGRYPVIGFSHGAFATPGRYAVMLGPLAAAGHVVIAPMHPDSEEFPGGQEKDQQRVWDARNADLALALEPPAELRAQLTARGIALDDDQTVAMGHSYGGLTAQLAAGARALAADGTRPDHSHGGLDALVAWSPPGPWPGRIDAAAWSTVNVPSLTITGTADVLPGFVDDWRLHGASYDAAPPGTALLWVGDGVDHYFGGMFGREKPANDQSRKMFARAMAQTLGFLDRALGNPAPCTVGHDIGGETLARN